MSENVFGTLYGAIPAVAMVAVAVVLISSSCGDGPAKVETKVERLSRKTQLFGEDTGALCREIDAATGVVCYYPCRNRDSLSCVQVQMPGRDEE